MNRKKWIAAVIALMVVAAVAGYLLSQPFVDEPGYRFGKVERGDITAVVSATGTLNPVVSVSVGSQVSGQIKELLVDFNSLVKKGQVIARIDPDSFSLRVAQAMADLEAARATVLTQRANIVALQAEVSRAKVNLADAQRELQRNKSLVDRNFISVAVLEKSQATFDAVQEQVKAAQAQLAVGEAQVRNVEALVKQREAQLAQAKVDLDRTTIRAPVDGIVVKKSVEPGQTVAASLQAPELFVIAQDLRDMQVEASIDEAEIGRVRVGQVAAFTVDSFPGRTFRGTVSQVRKAAQVIQNVVTYTAVIATSNPDASLFPGMTANVRIVAATREKVLRVPNAALRFRPVGVAAARETGAAPDSGGGSAAAGAGKGSGKGGEAMRERLTKELNLDAEQQSRLEAIFKETGEKIRALTIEDPGARRKEIERLRGDSRARIAEMLKPEQRARYEAMNATREAGQAVSGRVWILDADGKPKAIAVRTGLSDGTQSELISGELTEGAEVIIGVAEAKGKAQPSGGPRFGF